MTPSPSINMHIGGTNAAQSAFDLADAQLKGLALTADHFNSAMGAIPATMNAVQRAFQDATKGVDTLRGGVLDLHTAMGGLDWERPLQGVDKLTAGYERNEIAIRKQIVALHDLRTASEHMPAGGGIPVPSGGSGAPYGSTPGGHDAAGHPFGAGVARDVATGIGYYAGYEITNYAGQGFSSDLDYQRQMATNRVTTNISGPTQAALDAYITDLAGGGTQPYSKDTLAQGVGLIGGATNDLGAIKAVNRAAYMGSAMDMSPDTQTNALALTQTLGAYGYRDPKSIAANAMPFEDIIQNAINVGVLKPDQAAGTIATFAPQAASVGMSFGGSMGMFGALTDYARDPQMAAQQMHALITDVTTGPSRNKGQRDAIHAAGLDQYFGPHAMEMDPSKWLTGVESHIAKDPGKYLPLLFRNADALAGMQGLIGDHGANMGDTLSRFSQMGQTGSTERGFNIFEQNPAAKFDNAANQFNTGVENFMTAATPLATAMTKLATEGIHIIDDLVKKPGDTLGDAANTLRHLVTIGDPGFMNHGVAQQESGADQQAGRRPNTAGGFVATMDRFGDWLSGTDTVSYGDAGKGILKAAGGVGDWLSGNGTLSYPAMFGGGAAKAASAPAPFVGPRQPSLHDTLQGGYHATSDPTWQGVANGDPAATGANSAAEYQDRFNPGRHLLAMQAEQVRRNAPPGPLGGPTDYNTLDAMTQGQHPSAANTPAAQYSGARHAFDAGVQQYNAGAITDSQLQHLLQAVLTTIPGMHQGAAQTGYLQYSVGNQAAQAMNRRGYNQTLEGDTGTMEAARLTFEAAQKQHETPDLIRKAFADYIDAEKKLLDDKYPKGGAAYNTALGNLSAQQLAFGADPTAQGLTYQQQQLQDKVTLAGLQHNPASLAAAQANLRGFDTANAGILNLSPTQLQIQGLQDSQGAAGTKLGLDQSHLALLQSQGDTAGAKKLIDQILADEKATGVNQYQLALDKQNLLGALPKTPAPQLVRPLTDGPGDLTAGYGQVDARQALPERPRAGEQQQIALLEQQVEFWKKKDARDAHQIEILARSLHEQQQQTRGIGTLVVAGEARAKAAGTSTHSGPPLRPHR